METTNIPNSLIEMTRYFSDVDVCIEFVASLRWLDDNVVCPHCEGTKVGFLKTRRIWKCKVCRKQFSVKTGTIFEESPIALDKWLMAIWLVVNCKNGISSYELAKDLGLTQKSAWFMLHRVRLALRSGNWGKLGGDGEGTVEADEAFIGGKAKNMHLNRRKKITQVSSNDKAVVFGMLDRETRQVRASVVPDVSREVLQKEILDHVALGSKVYTDRHQGYNNMDGFVRRSVNHLNEYVRGEVHTNGIENFWSLLKRGLNGTYVAVEPFHLGAYVDEQIFRFNNRATKDNPLNDADRFMLAVSQISGKRLTYAELTGKVSETAV